MVAEKLNGSTVYSLFLIRRQAAESIGDDIALYQFSDKVFIEGHVLYGSFQILDHYDQIVTSDILYIYNFILNPKIKIYINKGEAEVIFDNTIAGVKNPPSKLKNAINMSSKTTA